MWATLGPTPIAGTLWGKVAGRVTSLALDLTHDPSGNTLYVGSAYGGVWKSTNAASGTPSYTPISDATRSLAVGSIALDTSTTPPIIYVGTGEPNESGDSYYGVGVMRSSDGGTTWSLATSSNGGTFSFYGLSFSKILVDAVNPKIVLAASVEGNGLGGSPFGTQPGIFRSTDSGTTWTNVYPGSIQSSSLVTNDLVYDSTRKTYFAANSGHGFYKSTDQGATWTALPSPFFGAVAPAFANFLRASLAVRGGTLWGVISDSSFNLSTPTPGKDTGLVQSTDGGNTWSAVAAPANLFNNQGFYDQYVAAPAGSTALVVAGVDTFVARSVHGTSTVWTNTTNAYGGGNVHADEHAFAAIDATHWYTGNDGGAYRTDNAAATWTSVSANLSIAQFYSATPDPFTAGTYFGGTQDNGTLLTTGTATWTQFFSGDGGYTQANPNKKQQYFFQFQGIDVYWSDNGGTTASLIIDSSTIGVDFSTFFVPFKLAPSDTTHMVLGTNHVWRGPTTPTTPGAGWTSISPGLGSPVSDLTVAPTSADVIYAGTTSAKIWKTLDATSATPTWTDITPSSLLGSVGAVAVHPTSASTVFLGVQGFARPHVLLTANGGTSWTNISGNLPDAPVNAVLIDPLAPSNVYVGSDVGVFVITDGGAGGASENWQRLGTGLPDTAVVDLKLATVTPRLIVAATHGRGAWAVAPLTAGCTTGCPATQINCGGGAVAPFVADSDFTGGGTISHPNTIDLTGVTNPAPMAVYQTARIGTFSYTIPGFVAGSSHNVRLHFAETYFSTKGSRTFNVSINGAQVLAGFDVFAAAGAKNKAVIEQFTKNADTTGAFVIQFTTVVNNGLVSGIEIQ
jgi:hypothetical protein